MRISTQDVITIRNYQYNQIDCEHNHWIAKCSHCGQILASDTQDLTDRDIRKIVEIIKKLREINIC